MIQKKIGETRLLLPDSPLANARFGANALGQQAGIWLRLTPAQIQLTAGLQIPANRYMKFRTPPLKG